MTWAWDSGEHVDPLKEATAVAMSLANNTTTLATEYARLGRDWKVELRQRAAEVEFAKSLGLDLNVQAQQKQQADAAPGE